MDRNLNLNPNQKAPIDGATKRHIILLFCLLPQPSTTMGVWENLSDDYRNYLSNFITREEFEAAPILDRAQLRNDFDSYNATNGSAKKSSVKDSWSNYQELKDYFVSELGLKDDENLEHAAKVIFDGGAKSIEYLRDISAEALQSDGVDTLVARTLANKLKSEGKPSVFDFCLLLNVFKPPFADNEPINLLSVLFANDFRYHDGAT